MAFVYTKNEKHIMFLYRMKNMFHREYKLNKFLERITKVKFYREWKTE